MTTRAKQVGTLITSKPATRTQFYECAAWFKKFEIAAGSFPLLILPRYEYRENGPALPTIDSAAGLWAPVEGRVVDCSLRSRLGAHYGSDRGPEEIGNVESTTLGRSTFGTLEDADALDGIALDPRLVRFNVWQSETMTAPMWRLELLDVGVDFDPALARPARLMLADAFAAFATEVR